MQRKLYRGLPEKPNDPVYRQYWVRVNTAGCKENVVLTRRIAEIEAKVTAENADMLERFCPRNAMPEIPGMSANRAAIAWGGPVACSSENSNKKNKKKDKKDKKKEKKGKKQEKEEKGGKKGKKKKKKAGKKGLKKGKLGAELVVPFEMEEPMVEAQTFMAKVTRMVASANVTKMQLENLSTGDQSIEKLPYTLCS